MRQYKSPKVRGGYDRVEAARERFQQSRKEALAARTSLIIHRQACGFRSQNHALISKMYPIRDEP